MRKLIIFGIALIVVGCATAERVVPAPVILPDEGVVVSYSEMHPKLRQIAWKATEAYYRDDWKDLGETSQNLEKAARHLKGSKEPPPRLNAVLAPKCDELSNESVQLRNAAQAAAIDQIGVHLQRINNLVRELRPDN